MIRLDVFSANKCYCYTPYRRYWIISGVGLKNQYRPLFVIYAAHRLGPHTDFLQTPATIFTIFFLGIGLLQYKPFSSKLCVVSACYTETQDGLYLRNSSRRHITVYSYTDVYTGHWALNMMPFLTVVAAETYTKPIESHLKEISHCIQEIHRM